MWSTCIKLQFNAHWGIFGRREDKVSELNQHPFFIKEENLWELTQIESKSGLAKGEPNQFNPREKPSHVSPSCHRCRPHRVAPPLHACLRSHNTLLSSLWAFHIALLIAAAMLIARCLPMSLHRSPQPHITSRLCCLRSSLQPMPPPVLTATVLIIRDTHYILAAVTITATTHVLLIAITTTATTRVLLVITARCLHVALPPPSLVPMNGALGNGRKIGKEEKRWEISHSNKNPSKTSKLLLQWVLRQLATMLLTATVERRKKLTVDSGQHWSNIGQQEYFCHFVTSCFCCI